LRASAVVIGLAAVHRAIEARLRYADEVIAKRSARALAAADVIIHAFDALPLETYAAIEAGAWDTIIHDIRRWSAVAA
jgi:hypothetical protein